MEATDAAAAVPQKNPDRKNRRERKKSRRTNGGHAAAALQTRNPRPGRGRRPMNRHGRGTGARPAPGRAIRKRRSRRKRPARHPQSGMCKNPAWAAKNKTAAHTAVRCTSNAQLTAGARTLADEPARTGYGGPARAGPGDTEARERCGEPAQNPPGAIKCRTDSGPNPCSNMNGWAEYGRSAARSRQGNVRKSR